MANKRIDEPTGTEFVGHEWDGIEELDTPMPRWWLWTFYLTIAWAVVYVVLYPAWPMVSQATAGVLGWSSRGQLAQEIAAEGERKAPILTALAQVPIERLPEDSERMRAAVAGGRAAFKVNCVQCHGAGAAGSAGYPNLNDDDWLWGGTLDEIHKTILFGARSGHKQAHESQMPAFGRDGMLKRDEMVTVANYVRSLAGLSTRPGSDLTTGKKLFADNCAVCHGDAGKGKQDLGSPNLTDAIWLYGSDEATIIDVIANSRASVMPAWAGRLDPATIKALAVYIHTRGGGK